jgi:hypothetical protein
VDPLSALVFAILVTHVIMKAAGQAAADQARAELRTARAAVRRDLQRRRTAAADRLWRRLEASRVTGPRTGWWWAWAALRTRSALRRAWQQRRRPAEQRRRGGRPTTGPVGRIIGAGWRGGRYAWQEVRRQWQEGRQRPEPVSTGVCERCGAVVAVAALAEGLTRHGQTARMCAWCRAACDRERQADAAAADDGPAVDDAEVVDAEIVDDPPVGQPELKPEDRTGPGVSCVRCGSPVIRFDCSNPGCPLNTEHARALTQAGPDAVTPGRFRLPVRFCPECSTQLVPGTWYAVNATNADVCLFCARNNHPEGACRQREPVELAATGEPLDAQGNPLPMTAELYQALAVAAAQKALVAAGGDGPACAWCGFPLDSARCCARCDAPQDSPPERPAGEQPPALAAAPASDEGDQMSCEVHSQAAWAAAAEAVQDTCRQITESAENMLRALNSKNAGRGHISLAKEWHDRVAAVVNFADGLIDEVNTHQDPYVDAVQGAGGSTEVADPDYYDEM